jgi:predicted component of type VI protein secretion system
MKSDLLERINKGEVKRNEDVCHLLMDKTIKRKIEKLINTKGAQPELKKIFTCTQRP